MDGVWMFVIYNSRLRLCKWLNRIQGKVKCSKLARQRSVFHDANVHGGRIYVDEQESNVVVLSPPFETHPLPHSTVSQ